MFTVEYYELPSGRKPALDFIESLDPKMKAKVQEGLVRLEQYGNALREPYSSPMGSGLFELRIKQSRRLARVFYFFVVGNKVILTNGFQKKTQKTPQAEIKLARRYKADYERRNPNDF